jgi:hypothetical protein
MKEKKKNFECYSENVVRLMLKLILVLTGRCDHFGFDELNLHPCTNENVLVTAHIIYVNSNTMVVSA